MALGDQREQNGDYKMNLTREKQGLLQYKQRMSLPQHLTRSDVLPVLHRVFPNSFGREDMNIRAMVRLGWYHMNRALINDPQVLQRATSSASANASESQSFANTEALRLNVSHGVVGTTFLDS